MRSDPNEDRVGVFSACAEMHPRVADIRQRSEGCNALTAKLCRAPEDVEVAEALGVDVQTLWKWESDVEGAIRVPIDRPANRLCAGAAFFAIAPELTPDLAVAIDPGGGGDYRRFRQRLT